MIDYDNLDQYGFSNNNIINFRTCLSLAYNVNGVQFYRCGLNKMRDRELNALYEYYDIGLHVELKERHTVSQRANRAVNYFHIPLTDVKITQMSFPSLPQSWNFRDFYISLFQAYKQTIGKMINDILEYIVSNSDKKNVLISCFAGKDRTGVVCAIISLLLGCSWSSIINDFMKTDTYLKYNMPYFQRNWKKRNLNQEQYIQRIKPHERAISEFLSYITHDFGQEPINLAKSMAIDEKLLKQVITQING